MNTIKNNKVVYTCITGEYDNVQEHNYIAPDWDYVLFSDDEKLIKKGKVYCWEVRKIDIANLNNSKKSRFPKMNPHIVLPEYNYSFYIDGNVIINNKSVFDNLEEMISKDVIVAIPFHPERDCVYEEGIAIKNFKKDTCESVDETVAFLKSKKYPPNNGLFENCLIYRKHNDERIIKAQEIWWKLLKKYSKRDQLLGMYAYWKEGVNIKPLYDTVGYHKNSKDYIFIYAKKHAHTPLLPRWLIRLICLFIPIKNYRNKLRDKLRNITK